MFRSRSRSPLPGRRLLATSVLALSLTAAGFLTATAAQGSPVPGATATGTPTPSNPGPSPTPDPTPSGTPSSPGPSPVPPSPPKVTATSATSTSITLTWTPSTPGSNPVIGYHVLFYNPFSDVRMAMKAGNATTATLTPLSPKSEYAVSVAAEDSAGKWSYSPELRLITPATDSGPDTTPPQAPTGLTVGGVFWDGVALRWQPASDDTGVTGYDVYWFDGWYGNRLLATVTGTTYTAPLTPTPLRNMFYVRARDAAGNLSLASNTVLVNATTPPPPPPPTCRIAYATTAQGANRFTARVTISNIGTAPVNGWTLSFSYGGGQRITSAWNTRYTQDGAAVTARDEGWNSALAVGASTTIGLQGTSPRDAASPTFFLLNGRPCTTT